MTDDTLLTFPCHFPIKVIGKHTPTFVNDILMLTQAHYPDFTADQIKFNTSKNQAYLALTLSVYAKDKATLDDLYRALSNHPDIKMVL